MIYINHFCASAILLQLKLSFLQNIVYYLVWFIFTNKTKNKLPEFIFPETKNSILLSSVEITTSKDKNKILYFLSSRRTK